MVGINHKTRLSHYIVIFKEFQVVITLLFFVGNPVYDVIFCREKSASMLLIITSKLDLQTGSKTKLDLQTGPKTKLELETGLEPRPRNLT